MLAEKRQIKREIQRRGGAANAPGFAAKLNALGGSNRPRLSSPVGAQIPTAVAGLQQPPPTYQPPPAGNYNQGQRPGQPPIDDPLAPPTFGGLPNQDPNMKLPGPATNYPGVPSMTQQPSGPWGAPGDNLQGLGSSQGLSSDWLAKVLSFNTARKEARAQAGMQNQVPFNAYEGDRKMNIAAAQGQTTYPDMSKLYKY